MIRDWGIFGREAEMERISAIMDVASGGEGRTVSIVGEPGVGKTRLVAEIQRAAKSKGFEVVQGVFSKDSARPYEAFCKSLGEDLVQSEEHVTFAQILVIDESGLLVAKAVPQGAEDVDSDIFAGMLTAVQNFVKDSFGGGEGSLGRLEYGEMKIVMESMGPAILVAFFKGTEHQEMAPFVKSGAKRIAQTYGTILQTWGGRTESVTAVQREIEKLATARFLVRRELAGVKLDKERLRIADQILTRLQRRLRQSPVLLVLEDIQWTDEGSLHALGYLARNAPQARLLVVATSRQSESPKVDGALKELSLEGAAEVFDLRGISADAVSALLTKEFSPNDFPLGFSSRMALECKGNPFFLTEVLRQMLADGNIRLSEGRYSLLFADTPLPKTVDELVQRRLDSLDPDAIALAEYASCAGKEFHVSAALSMRSLKDSPMALEKLREAGIVLISESGAGEFSHAFYRDAIYGNIVPRWKSVYHKGLGEHYERAYDGRLDEAAYELARHFSMTSDKPKAYRYGVMAGEKAEAAYAVEQAIAFYGKALEALQGMQKGAESLVMMADLNERMGDILTHMGAFTEAESRFSMAAEGSVEPVVKARLLRKTSSVLQSRGDYNGALKVLDLAMHSLGATRDAERGRILIEIAVVRKLKGEFDGAILGLTEAERELLEFPENQRDRLEAANLRGTIEWRRGNLEAALASMLIVEDISLGIGDERLTARAEVNLGNVYNDMGNYEKSGDMFKASLARFQKIGDIQAQAIVLNNIGSQHSDKGDVELAIDYFSRSLETRRRIGDRKGVAYTLNNIGNQLKFKGEYEKARERFIESKAILEEIGDKVVLPVIFKNLSDCHRAFGQTTEARKLQEERLALDRANGNRADAASAMTDLAELALADGVVEGALEKAREGLAILVESGCKIDIGMAHRAIAMCLREAGDFDAALECIREAKGIFTELKARRDFARTLYEEAILLERMGRADEAMKAMATAIDLFEDMGNRFWSAKCAAALAVKR
ncbi:MAG: tetratricopeptide repeat protein [Methanobacteriota archaeon]